MVVNTKKEKSSYVYYIKDTNCSDKVSMKEPYELVKYDVTKFGLIVIKKQNKNEIWYNDLNKEIKKYKLAKKCNQCISIKENKNTYYIKKKNLKKLENILDK